MFLETGGSMAWIGSFRVGPLEKRNDQWTWIDGSPITFSNWASENQPSNGGGDEFCGMVNRWKTEGLWNDAPCDWMNIQNFVCQL